MVDGYNKRGLPLHVLVMDMEWHEIYAKPPACDLETSRMWGVSSPRSLPVCVSVVVRAPFKIPLAL